MGVEKAQTLVLQSASGLRVGGEVLYGLGEVEDMVGHPLQLGEQLGLLVLGDVVEEDHQLVLRAGRALTVGLHEPAQRQRPKRTHTRCTTAITATVAPFRS